MLLEGCPRSCQRLCPRLVSGILQPELESLQFNNNKLKFYFSCFASTKPWYPEFEVVTACTRAITLNYFYIFNICKYPDVMFHFNIY